MQKKIIYILILVLVGAAAYLLMTQVFFQQDEWAAFGEFLHVRDGSAIDFLKSKMLPSLAHYVPLTHVVSFFFFKLFSTNALAYALFSVGTHILITVLLFTILVKIHRGLMTSFLVALFFLLNMSASQATTWLVANINTQGALIFGLLSLYTIIVKKKKYTENASIAFFLVSLLFKENTAFLVVLLPLALYFFGNKNNLKRFLIKITAVFLLYILFRLLSLIVPADIVGIATSTAYPSVRSMVVNSITGPGKALLQLIIPPEIIMLFFSYRKVWFIITLVVSILMGVVGLLSFNKNKFVSYGLIWLVLSTPIYAISPERTGFISALDSRNLYIPLIGLCIVILAVAKTSTRKIFLALLIALNLFLLERNLIILRNQSVERTGILNKIHSFYPQLESETVIYTESDRSYYGLADTSRMLPFQSGFGQTLLVTYQHKMNYSPDFFDGKFLWNITSQGYKNSEGKGFGYFNDFETLLAFIKENNFPIQNVRAVRFSGSVNSLSDITKEVQSRLEGANSPKSLLSSSRYAVTTQFSVDKVPLLSDQDNSTYWETQIPNIYSQSLTITLDKPTVISQIQLDNGIGQNPSSVGLAVLLSTDGVKWEKVYQVDRALPEDKRYFNLYFNPEMTKYIKIEQTGSDKFSSLKIAELSIYETNK